LIAASSASVGRINLVLIVVDISVVRLAQADDSQGLTLIDKHDAIEAAPDRSIANLPRFAIIDPGIEFRQNAVPIEPLHLAQRNTVLDAIDRVFRWVKRELHINLCMYKKEHCQSHIGSTPQYVTGYTRSPYDKWREYDPEDTIRFYALSLRDAGFHQVDPAKDHCRRQRLALIE
jgi:hypothetical protein